MQKESAKVSKRSEYNLLPGVRLPLVGSQTKFKVGSVLVGPVPKGTEKGALAQTFVSVY